MLTKTIFFPGAPIEYIPTLRVDLVGLPDFKKNEVITPKPLAETPKTEEKKEQLKPKIKVEADDGDMAVSKKKEKESKSKTKQALDRIKALERVKALAGDEIKGNQISKGSAITGAARASLQASYFDSVTEQIRNNWELPKWLADQKLSAQIVVWIDAQGRVRNLRFKQSSGNEQFDSEVRRTIQASSPFPAPPKDIVDSISEQGVILGFPL